MSLEDVTKEELFKVLNEIEEARGFGIISNLSSKPVHDPPKWEAGWDSEGLNTEPLSGYASDVLNRLNSQE